MFRRTFFALTAATMMTGPALADGHGKDIVDTAVEAGSFGTLVAAVEAAAGEALRAVVVDDVDRARNALDELVGADLAGAVLALGSMPAELRAHSAGSEQRAGGTGGKAARSLVRATRPDVEPLLDRLLSLTSDYESLKPLNIQLSDCIKPAQTELDSFR